MEKITIDSDWTLFLDRDGVINVRKIGGYIQSVDEFQFLPNVDKTIAQLSNVFKYVIVVTNQQGIAKGLMTEEDLEKIHQHMLASIEKLGGKITKCYHAPALAHENSPLRKPNIGMGLLAKEDFLDIDFSKSIMVGDSDTDIQFGTKLGMKTVRILTDEKIKTPADFSVNSLNELIDIIK